MKKTLLFIVVCVVSTTTFAQPPTGQSRQGENFGSHPEQSHHRQPLSPQQIAGRRTEIMSMELDLTEKQRKKVYKINLAQAENAQQTSPAAATPPRNFGTAAPGHGMRPTGGGMGMGGHGGGQMGMRPPGGGMPGGGMGMGGPPEGGDSEGRPDGRFDAHSGTPPPMVNFHEESEKEIAARHKKMQKILSAEQFGKWQKMDYEHRRDEIRRMFDRQTASTEDFN